MVSSSFNKLNSCEVRLVSLIGGCFLLTPMTGRFFSSPGLLVSGDHLLDRASCRRSCACVRKLIDDASIEDCLLPPASQSSPLRAAMTYSSPRLLRLPRVVPLVVSSRAAVFLFPFLVDSFSWTPLLEPEFSILYDSLEFDFVLANSPDRHRPTRLHHIQTKAR